MTEPEVTSHDIFNTSGLTSILDLSLSSDDVNCGNLMDFSLSSSDLLGKNLKATYKIVYDAKLLK